MKIAIVSDVLGLENNGTTITAKRLIANLKERGHEVVVVSPLKTDEKGYYTVPKRDFWVFNDYVAKNGVELAKADKTILREALVGCDVVHIILPFQLGLAAQEVAMEMHIPMTSAFHCQAENVTSHVFMQNVKLANKFIYLRFLEKFYKHQQFVHCPTEFIANVLRKNHYNMDLRVISNGVDPGYVIRNVAKPKELQDKYCILFTGRLSREKRHDLLIKAVKYSKYQDKIQLLFAGNGPLERSIRKMGSKLINPPIIGFYKENDLVDIINYSDLYVHPADIEIEAIACLEAITCGLVPIISDSKKSATNSFALNQSNLFKARDYKDLAKKIDYFIENPEVLESQKKNYIEYAKRFQISSCIDKMEEMFKDSINFFKGKYQ